MTTRFTLPNVGLGLSVGLIAACSLLPVGCKSDHSASSSTAQTPAMGAAAGTQLMFNSPQDLVDALVDGARRRDREYLRSLFGPEIERMTSGDHKQDDIDFQVFVAAYNVYHTLDRTDDGAYLLVMGEQRWVFPAPIVRDGSYWRFDTNAGVDEVITRTIGANELNVIEAVAVFAGAQEEYLAMDPDGDTVPAYAVVIRSSPGKRDGLYWADEPGAPMSPFGPLFAEAVQAGDLDLTKDRQPYRGYYYRILTSQGAGAPGGVMNYIDDSGRMTRGYALLAWPASYGETGVMSFIVAKDGVVYERDLGDNTASQAETITTYDPAGWTAVE